MRPRHACRGVRALTAGAGILLGFLVAGAPSAHAAASTRAAASRTVWLCRPGASPDPCGQSLAATAVGPSGARTPARLPAGPRRHGTDCFYVYPTVSTEATPNADLRIQPAEQAAARAQASPFSPVCTVWAPMYRQSTLSALLHGTITSQGLSIAYDSLRAAFSDFLAHDDHGRPIVFIGHSQGAAMLIRLLRSVVDPSTSLRHRMLMAIILGGNVQVPDGRIVGGSFAHIPLCTARAARGCVIAYSTFPGQPPAGALFGRPGSGVSLQSGQRTSHGQSVACVNPAALGGGAGTLSPWFPTAQEPGVSPPVATPWVTFPALYRSSCRHGGGATWLQVTDIAAAGDTRPTVHESLGPLWGYHLYDVNLAVGNLVGDVAAAERAGNPA